MDNQFIQEHGYPTTEEQADFDAIQALIGVEEKKIAKLNKEIKDMADALKAMQIAMTVSRRPYYRRPSIILPKSLR